VRLAEIAKDCLATGTIHSVQLQLAAEAANCPSDAALTRCGASSQSEGALREARDQLSHASRSAPQKLESAKKEVEEFSHSRRPSKGGS